MTHLVVGADENAKVLHGMTKGFLCRIEENGACGGNVGVDAEITEERFIPAWQKLNIVIEKNQELT